MDLADRITAVTETRRLQREREHLARGSQLVDRHRLVRAVGLPGAARTVVQGGHAGADVQPEVAAVRTPSLGSGITPGHPAVGVRDQRAQRVAGRQLTAAEHAHPASRPVVGGRAGRGRDPRRQPPRPPAPLGPLPDPPRSATRSGPRRPAGPARCSASRRPGSGPPTADRGSGSPASSARVSVAAPLETRPVRRGSPGRSRCADDPSYRVLPWVARPGTSIRNVSDPALAVTRRRSVGSGMMQASPAVAAGQRREGTETAVLLPDHEVHRVRRHGSTAARDRGRPPPRMPATPPFMSQAPRPITRPSADRGRNGSLAHAAGSPVGTTSTWPCRIERGPLARAVGADQAPGRGRGRPPRRDSPAAARRSARSIGHRSTSSPRSASRAASRCWIVDLGRRCRRRWGSRSAPAAWRSPPIAPAPWPPVLVRLPARYNGLSRTRGSAATRVGRYEFARADRRRLAVRQRPAAHRSRLRLRGSLRRLLPVHADERPRRADGLRHRRARHARSWSRPSGRA